MYLDINVISQKIKTHKNLKLSKGIRVILWIWRESKKINIGGPMETISLHSPLFPFNETKDYKPFLFSFLSFHQTKRGGWKSREIIFFFFFFVEKKNEMI